MENTINLFKNSKKGYTIKNIANFFFILYMISLFIFVDNPSLNKFSEFIFICFAFFTLIHIIIQKKFYFEFQFIFIVFFIIFCILSILWAIDQSVALSMSITLIQLFILFFLVYNLFIDQKNNDILPIAIIISGFSMFIYSSFIYGITNIYKSIIEGTRLGRDINQENTFGILSAITFITCIYYALIKKQKYFYLLCIIPIVFIVSSGSRKALLMVPIGYMLLLFFRFGFKRIYKYIFYSILFLICFYFLLQINFMSSINFRLNSMINLLIGGKVDSSTIIRKNMIIIGIDLFKNKPLLGYGINNYRIISGYNSYSHNNFIELLVDVGIVGFILYYLIYVYLIFYLFKKALKKDALSMLIVTILIVLLIMDVGSVSYYGKMIYIFFAFGFLLIRL